MLCHVISTGSRANTYILTAGADSLVLDAGVSIKAAADRFAKAGKLWACLVTHEHADHMRAWRDYAMRGIPVVMSAGTFEHTSDDETVLPVIAKARELLTFGPWQVLPFETQHDAVEPFGYLIRYLPTGETILYATDTYYIRYRFPGVHYWIIECNYCDELLEEETNQVLRKRLNQSHMSLSRLCACLIANDLKFARKILLVHLSDQRSKEAEMVEKVACVTGVDTEAARDGETYRFEPEPF